MTPHERRTSSEATEPLVSDFAQDADMAELVEFFMTELNERIDSMTQAWRDGDRPRLKTLAHQLKGAAGGYGYPSITESAAQVEAALLAQEADASSILEKIEDLIGLCKRATLAASKSNGERRG